MATRKSSLKKSSRPRKMALGAKRMSKTVMRKKTPSTNSGPFKKILTAEGWKRLMMGRSRKSSV